MIRNYRSELQQIRCFQEEDGNEMRRILSLAIFHIFTRSCLHSAINIYYAIYYLNFSLIHIKLVCGMSGLGVRRRHPQPGVLPGHDTILQITRASKSAWVNNGLSCIIFIISIKDSDILAYYFHHTADIIGWCCFQLCTGVSDAPNVLMSRCACNVCQYSLELIFGPL